MLPGQSGNPSGRPALPKSFRIAVREFMTGTGWEKLFRMAKNERSKYKPEVQFRAIELLAGYAYGKPPQRHEILTEDDGSRGVVEKLAGIMAVQMGLHHEAEGQTVEGMVLEVFPGSVEATAEGVADDDSLHSAPGE